MKKMMMSCCCLTRMTRSYCSRKMCLTGLHFWLPSQQQHVPGQAFAAGEYSAIWQTSWVDLSVRASKPTGSRSNLCSRLDALQILTSVSMAPHHFVFSCEHQLQKKKKKNLREVSCAGIVMGDSNGQVHIQHCVPPASRHIYCLSWALQVQMLLRAAVCPNTCWHSHAARLIIASAMCEQPAF